MTKDVRKFTRDVEKEFALASNKFPYPNPNIAALVEEVGELARAFLEGQAHRHLYREAVQVAAMAMRCALEGDPQFKRIK